MKPFCNTIGVLAISILILTLRTAPAHAGNMLSYDLDSLVYLANDVVGADLVPGQCTRDTMGVRLTRVYRGHLAVGLRVTVIGTNVYSIPWPKAERGGKVTPGAVAGVTGRDGHCFLFLTKTDPLGQRPPLEPNSYFAVPSGIRMVVDGLALGFFPGDTHDYYELEDPAWHVTPGPPGLRRFRADLATSIRYVDRVEPLLLRKATGGDRRRLLAILKQRQVQGEKRAGWLRDAIAEAAWDQITALHNLPALGDALAILRSKAHPALPGLDMRALSATADRDYLIQVAGARSQPLVRRLGCANALLYAYDWHNAEKNKDFVPGVVSLCSQVQVYDTPEVLSAVLDCLDGFERAGVGAISGSEANPSIRTAIPTFERIYAATSSELVKFRIEKLVLDADAFDTYTNLASPCGPVVSIIEPGDAPAGQGRIAVKVYVYWGLLNPPDVYSGPNRLVGSMVFLHTATNQRHAAPWYLGLGENMGGWIGGNEEQVTMKVDLPPHLPHGHYRVFLEFSRDGKVISVGHYMETDL